MMTISEIALLYLPMKIPYRWGGNDMTVGVDCSGFVCELARAAGLLDKRDLTAQGLYDYFLPRAIANGLGKDALLFFGEDTDNIKHVAIAINPRQMIEAGGEGRIDTEKGYVRIRPIAWRNDLVSALQLG